MSERNNERRPFPLMPAVLTARSKAPSSVLAKEMSPLPVEVSVVLAVKLTLPL